MTQVQTSPHLDASLRELLGPDNLVDAVRNAHALLSLVSILEIEDLPPGAQHGFQFVVDQTLIALERAEDYLAKEQRAIGLCQDGQENRP